jgi:uncharacterized protein (UPF0276 family)
MLHGIGLGLRFKYIDDLQQNSHLVKWFELLADHYHDINNPIVNKVQQLCTKFPCVLHAVNFSLASSSELNQNYLNSIKTVVDLFNPLWVSDHLSFSSIGDVHLHELLPFAFTEAMLEHIATKIIYIQQTLNRPFLIENISSYIRLKDSQMSEAEFIAKLAVRADCGILLDVNNIVVSCHNHNESIDEYYAKIPFNRVKQMHMAGAITKNNLLIDTHSRPIADNVLQLYRKIIHDHGYIPTCLEWDMDLPDFAVIIKEVEKLNAVI